MVKKNQQKLTAREKKEIRLKGINLKKIKRNLLKELYTTESKDIIGQFQNNTIINNKYEIKYQEYLNNTFNSRLVAMIISFIKKTKNLPYNLKKAQKFFINLIQIIKKLMMNEIEVTLFTLNIDHYDWRNNNFNPELSLLFLGLYTKQITNNDSSLFFTKFSKENKKFIENYKNWERNLKKDIFKFDKVNDKFKELNRPHNTYCKFDFIDYNGIVDIIYKLSQPYGEENKGGKIKVKEEDIYDNTNNINININNNNNLNISVNINNSININDISSNSINNNNISINNFKNYTPNNLILEPNIKSNKIISNTNIQNNKNNNNNNNNNNLIHRPTLNMLKKDSSFGDFNYLNNSLFRNNSNNLSKDPSQIFPFDFSLNKEQSNIFKFP